MAPMMTAAVFALALPGHAQHHPVYTGRVVRVLDGKTLQIKVRSRDFPADTMATARLWGIDLGKDKKHAQAAKDLLRKLALDRNVHVDVYGKGGWVRVEGSRTSLSAALVSAGLARRWKPSGIRDFEHHEKELELAESEAKEKKLGIWETAQPESTTGYALANGLNMYFDVHRMGGQVVLPSRSAALTSLRRDLRHGAFMTIANDWDAPNVGSFPIDEADGGPALCRHRGVALVCGGQRHRAFAGREL